MRKQCQFQEAEQTAPQTIFDDFREPRGARFEFVLDKMRFFSESVFSSIFGCLLGGSRRQRRGPSILRICRNMAMSHHARLPPAGVRRIYVAFGKHPAAGGSYMFFGSLWHFAWPCGVSLAL